MKFKKPRIVTDYTKAASEIAFAGAKFVYGDVVGSISHLPQFLDKLKGKSESNPENMAWTFLATCVSTALIMLLRVPRLRCELTDQELIDHAKGLTAALPDTGDIRPGDICNLALAQCTHNCIHQSSNFIAQAAPETNLDKGQLVQMYGRELARSVTFVFERHSDLFSEMVDSITGPTARAEMREIAWQRHSAWCRGLFCESPIFSPDSDIDIPLLDVYQKLRCYWNEDKVKSREGERDPLRYRTANVGDLHETIDTWLRKLDRGDALRLIAGGPGSGKSSFAKAFAAKLLQRKTHRVLFVQLQRLQTTGTTLREVIGRHLKDNYRLKPPNKCEGFHENPLDWDGEDTLPLGVISLWRCIFSRI